MTVKELLEGITIDPKGTGAVTNDDFVFAIDISEEQNAEIDDYAVAQVYISGVDANFSPDTTDSQYLRAGKSTTKTGTQSTYSITGDRFIGDPVQDFLLSHAMIYATGEKARVRYVRFNMINGKGEKGIVTVIVNSDGSGNAGSASAISIDLKKSGANPEKFQYVSKTDAEEINTMSTKKLAKEKETV